MHEALEVTFEGIVVRDEYVPKMDSSISLDALSTCFGLLVTRVLLVTLET